MNTFSVFCFAFVVATSSASQHVNSVRRAIEITEAQGNPIIHESVDGGTARVRRGFLRGGYGGSYGSYGGGFSGGIAAPLIPAATLPAVIGIPAGSIGAVGIPAGSIGAVGIPAGSIGAVGIPAGSIGAVGFPAASTGHGSYGGYGGYGARRSYYG